MSAEGVWLIFVSLATVAIFWSLPERHGQNAVAVVTLLGIAVLSPASALWLGGTVIATPAVLRAGSRLGRRGAAVALWGTILVGLLFATREVGLSLWIGGAYFTLRHLHVMIDWWRGWIETPTVGQYCRYHLFMPVVMAGPIHRLQNFERQCQRRRWDPAAFFSGAERALLGMGLYVVLAGWLVGEAKLLALDQAEGRGAFVSDWLGSLLFWTELYIGFSGLTSIALGLSLMMGLELEENFNRPWAAPNLIAFWSRWHMTLSHWCRDYVFQTVSALSRKPALGVIAAMLAMGLWHETSLYYLLWGLWQSLGIILTRVWMRYEWLQVPAQLSWVLGPVFVLTWLTLTQPVINIVLGATG